MAPKERREPEGNNRNQDSDYEESGIAELVDKTQDFFGVNDVEDDRDNRESNNEEDDFYRPFQHTPGTGPDDVPAEDSAAEADLADRKRNTRNTDRDRDY